MKRKIASIILVALLTLTMTMPAIFAQTAQQKKKDLQNKLNEAKSQKAETTQEKNEVLAEIDKLNEKITNYEKQISELNGKISKLKKSISTKQKEIKKLEKEFTEKEELLKERLVAMYEAGQTSYLDVLLSSDGIGSFISNYYMASQLAEADKEVLNSIEDQQAKIEKAKKELEQQKKEISKSKEQVEVKNNELNTTKSAKQSKVSSLSAKEKKLQAGIDKYESDLASVEAEIKRYEQKSSSSGSNYKYTGGKLGWPIPGYYSITSYYGYRIHPIYGYRKLHTGIDVGAPKGAKFVAAADGVVISASYSGGYGNRVIISHGGGISTLYAHGTSILVSAGQEVKKGTPVLTVGSTGLSTGNHAHFEVRVNGSCVDPMNYLK